MMGKETVLQINSGVSEGGCSPSDSDKEAGLETCRVCQCAESDKRGDAALEFLDIFPPLLEARKSDGELKPGDKLVMKDGERDVSIKKNVRESHFMELISPDGEVLICNADVEMGSCDYQDTLIELGCSCKNDLALVHYACALKWFVNHGSTVCEICGHVAKNIRAADYRKVLVSLKEYEALRERTASGEPNPAQVHSSTGVDPDAIAAIRRQRLSEISLWFGPHNNNNNNNQVTVSQAVSEQPMNTVTEEVIPAENTAARWAVEGTGILLATGLLTVTLACLIAPRVGKKTARSGLHILLGGICALTVVVFFRFFVLTRIKYGPARYWAILFVFWFLVFGIWASRAHGAHTT
ncbi:Zinc finger, RING-CH-type [Parasponia andersonii]|uniref:Zinc finger, RING-CH-type n=1 Tax=Parasponia andersonii TaxID=3476 RepID=A0A2P5CLA8_PARAD|nr:Zinc finger, RING-CH-type [Parasponia andersonii]